MRTRAGTAWSLDQEQSSGADTDCGGHGQDAPRGATGPPGSGQLVVEGCAEYSFQQLLPALLILIRQIAGGVEPPQGRLDLILLHAVVS